MRFVVTLVVVALLVFFGILIFNRPDSTTPKVAQKNLAEYADTAAQAVLETRGEINGEDLHRQLRITVSSSSRTLEIIQGYNDNVISTTSFANTPAAYSAFLSALQQTGFNLTRRTTASPDGFCPTGRVYNYILNNTGDTKSNVNLWNSSCGGGTAAGQRSTIRSLFQDQITDYNQLTSGVNL
jgi:hypothetical protein